MSAPASAQNGKVVIDPNLYDLNRIEVLRGPQGTLYGAGSMGGTIKLVPNAPNIDEFETSAQAILGGMHGGKGLDSTLNGMVNLPMGEALAVRLVASLGHTSGWIDRVVIADGEFPAPIGPTRGNVAAAPVAVRYHDVNDENSRTLRALRSAPPLLGGDSFQPVHFAGDELPRVRPLRSRRHQSLDIAAGCGGAGSRGWGTTRHLSRMDA